MVYRAKSPHQFWTFIFLYSLTTVGFLLSWGFALREFVVEQKRKNKYAREKKHQTAA